MPQKVTNWELPTFRSWVGQWLSWNPFATKFYVCPSITTISTTSYTLYESIAIYIFDCVQNPRNVTVVVYQLDVVCRHGICSHPLCTVHSNGKQQFLHQTHMLFMIFPFNVLGGVLNLLMLLIYILILDSTFSFLVYHGFMTLDHQVLTSVFVFDLCVSKHETVMNMVWCGGICQVGGLYLFMYYSLVERKEKKRKGEERKEKHLFKRRLWRIMKTYVSY